MSEFPKWLLALAGLSLIPLLACPLFLFGAQPFGTSQYGIVRFLLYLLTQLLWLAQTASFFVTLDLWRRGYNKASIALGTAAVVVSVLAFILIFR